MERIIRKRLCAWLAFCLLLGMFSVGLAEDQIVELPKTDGDAIEGNLAPEAVDIAADGLVLDNIELTPDLRTDIDLADNLVSGDEDRAREDAEVQPNNSNPEDFEIDDNGVLVKYRGAGGVVVIPEAVTSIGAGAFMDCSSLTEVIMNDYVTSIGKDAFHSCYNLKKVTLDDYLNDIGPRAFKWCSRLEELDLPESLLNIGEYAFQECNNLTRIDIRGGVHKIGDNAFFRCKNLASLTIREGVANIGERAFSNCGSLTSVEIPNSVSVIGEFAFLSCQKLERVTIGSDVSDIGAGPFSDCKQLERIDVSTENTAYTSRDGVLYTADMKTLVQCPGKKTSLRIPDGVTSFSSCAFRYCSALASVTIPDSMTSISDYAFYGCTGLVSVKMPDSVTSIGDNAFAECTGLASVKIPNGVTSIGSCAFYNCTSLASVKIPDGVVSIGDNAFKGCVELGSVKIPDSVTSIGSSAFSWCYKLTSVKIPDSVTSIGEDAFYECPSLTSVRIPGGVTSIGEYTFARCRGLTSVRISDGVTSIGDGAFRECDSLTRVTIPRSVTKIDSNAFWGDWDTLTIYGYKGSYAETYAAKQNFPFVQIDAPVSLAKAKVTVSDQVYTGKALNPAVKVVLNKKTLKKGTDYTVTYKNNKAIGTATVTVTGKGNYTGKAKATFKINPQKVTGLKLTAGKGLISVSWKKSAAGGVTGYQLQYALKKSFSGAKKATVPKAATVKRTLKNLEKGKTYYVRIRAYKKIGKTTYWSAWSAAKRAKVK